MYEVIVTAVYPEKGREPMHTRVFRAEFETKDQMLGFIDGIDEFAIASEELGARPLG